MSEERLLDGVRTPADLRELSREQVERIPAELRGEILDQISQTGGHLASSLGSEDHAHNPTSEKVERT